MASPIYGTQAAGYMNILAGRARGMAEAERMQRMQQQQDFGNAYQMLGMQDLVQARDQERADQQSWNAYNAAMQQRAFDNKYNFDVYDRAVAGDRYQDQQRMQGEQFAYKQQMDRAGMDRALANDAWGRQVDLLRLAPKPQDPMKQLEYEQALAGADPSILARVGRLDMLPPPEQPGLISKIAQSLPGVSGLAAGSSRTWQDFAPVVGGVRNLRRREAAEQFGPELQVLEAKRVAGTITPQEMQRLEDISERVARYVEGGSGDLWRYASGAANWAYNNLLPSRDPNQYFGRQ